MRNKKRISIILSTFDIWIQDFLVQRTGLAVIEIDEIIDNLSLRKDEIEKVWKRNPDMRFGQLLINYFNVPDYPRLWFIEESDWLVFNNYFNIEDICFWRVNYRKDGTLRKHPKTVLLRDLKTDHIAAILVFFEEHKSRIKPQYEEYFKKRLNQN